MQIKLAGRWGSVVTVIFVDFQSPNASLSREVSKTPKKHPGAGFLGNLVKPEGRERDRFVAEVVIAWVLTVFGAFWLCVFDLLLSRAQCNHRAWDARTKHG